MCGASNIMWVSIGSFFMFSRIYQLYLHNKARLFEKEEGWGGGTYKVGFFLINYGIETFWYVAF